MLKKLVTAALITSMLILPVNSAGPTGHEEASLPSQSQDYIPGDLPAQTGAEESMSPVLHAMLLAMLNHDVKSFDLSDSELGWEGLYNMLSLYGQLDSRSDEKNGELLMVGFVRRYGNDARILKDYIDNGYFGDIVNRYQVAVSDGQRSDETEIQII